MGWNGMDRQCGQADIGRVDSVERVPRNDNYKLPRPYK